MGKTSIASKMFFKMTKLKLMNIQVNILKLEHKLVFILNFLLKRSSLILERNCVLDSVFSNNFQYFMLTAEEHGK